MGSLAERINGAIERYAVRHAVSKAERGIASIEKTKARHARVELRFSLSNLLLLQSFDRERKTLGTVAARLAELGLSGAIVQFQGRPDGALQDVGLPTVYATIPTGIEGDDYAFDPKADGRSGWYAETPITLMHIPPKPDDSES